MRLLHFFFVIILLHTHFSGQSQTQNDSLALSEIYHALNGSQWMYSNLWESSAPLNMWYGVEADSEGNVTCLHMHNESNCYLNGGSTNKMRGVLPVLNLPHLQSFSAVSDTILEPLPDLSNLINLELFSLGSSQLPGGIENLTSLPNLNHINLSINKLSGPIPSFEGQPIVYMDLSNNKFTDSIPYFEFDSIVRINLFNNNLNSPIPDFENLMTLEYLGLGGSNDTLTGFIPDYNLPNLTHLSIYGVSDPQEIPNFDGLVNLQTLEMINGNLEGPIPHFTNSPQLTSISLSGNNLAGEIPNFNLPLFRLSLSSNNLEGQVPSFENTVLQSLDVEYNKLEHLPDLSDLPLSGLFIRENKFTFEDIIPNLNVPQFWYEGQDSIYRDTTFLLPEGVSLTIDLEIDDTVSTNQYFWYKDGNFIQQINDSNELIIPAVTFDDAGLYTCEIINPLAPDLTLQSRLINVDIVSGILGEIEVVQENSCYNDGVLIANATGGSGVFNFLWSTGSTNPQLENLGAGTYSVTISDANNTNFTTVKSVTLEQAVIQDFDLGEDIFLCEGTHYAAVDGFDNASYNWNDGSTNPLILLDSDGWYIVTVLDNNSGCTGTDSIHFETSNLDVEIQSDTFHCESELGNINAIASGSSGYVYQWNTGHTTAELLQFPFFSYALTVTDENLCSVSKSINPVFDSVFAVSHARNIYLCEGDDFTTLQVVFNENLKDYIIQLDRNCDQIIDETYSVAGNTISFLVANLEEWCVTVFDEYECFETTVTDVFDQQSQDCSIDCESYTVTIPEAITPNNDGYNDNFAISGIGGFPNNELIILNRNGQVLFQQSPYLSSAQWDGTFKGNPLPEGTYYYQLKLDDSCPIKTGSVLLIK